MSERCPLSDHIHWDSEIPEACRIQCGPFWEEAQRRGPESIDTFSDDLVSDVEHGGEALQRLWDNDSGRGFAVLSTIMGTDEDAFAEQYSFTCPHN